MAAGLPSSGFLVGRSCAMIAAGATETHARSTAMTMPRPVRFMNPSEAGSLPLMLVEDNGFQRSFLLAPDPAGAVIIRGKETACEEDLTPRIYREWRNTGGCDGAGVASPGRGADAATPRGSRSSPLW